MDAVVSMTTAMLVGWFLAPTMAEVETAEIVIWLTPKTWAKKVGMTACSFTWMAFAL